MKMTELPDLPTKLERLEINPVEDGYVVFDPQTDIINYLNPTSAVVFELCDGEHSHSDIIQAVSDLYESAFVDDLVANALDQLKNSGLIA